jgi:hypothetical protein
MKSTGASSRRAESQGNRRTTGKERDDNLSLLGGGRHFLGLHKENGMYSYEQRKRALLLYIKYDFSPSSVIRKLGYSNSVMLRKWFSKPNILPIDEDGYENLTPQQATLFFQLVNVRYEQGSIILTSNKPFGRWGEIMADDAVATASLDRLLHHAHVLSLKGDSYRMKDRMKIGVVDFQ